MYRKPDSDSASRSPTSQTPGEKSDELITNALRKLRPEDSPRSDAFETFYQAGYQAALAASQPQRVPSNVLTGFGWGAVGGAILTAAILLSITGIPGPHSDRPALDSGATATVESGSNDVAMVPQDAESPAESLAERVAEKIPQPIELASSPAFDLGRTLSLTGFWSNRGALDDRTPEAITVDDWSRRRSWQPLWRLRQSGTGGQDEGTERVASSDPHRPPAASVWQLRKQFNEIAL